MDRWLALLGVLTGLAGVIVGAGTTVIVGRLQVRAQVLSANRQNWINALRDDLASFVATLRVHGAPLFGADVNREDRSGARRELFLLRARIRMRLNPVETDHNELVGAMGEAEDAAFNLPANTAEASELLAEKLERLIAVAQRILKREWERVKRAE